MTTRTLLNWIFSSFQAEGKAEPSFTSTHLESLASKKGILPDDELVIRNTAAVIFAGGSDTVGSVINVSLTLYLLWLYTTDSEYYTDFHTCDGSIS